MIFEFGKKYIVDVKEKGIVPLMEFDKDRWYDKEHDDLDFLTDEEKVIVINTVLDEIKAEIYGEFMTIDGGVHDESAIKCMQIIDKYRGNKE